MSSGDPQRRSTSNARAAVAPRPGRVALAPILADVRVRLMFRMAAAVPAVAVALGLSACGGTSSTPRATLKTFLAGWQRGDWAAMRRQVATAPADFASINAQAFSALGVTHAQFTAGRITQRTHSASAPVTEHFTLPHVGALTTSTTVALKDVKGTWRVTWSPATISPALRAGDRLLVARAWPARARDPRRRRRAPGDRPRTHHRRFGGQPDQGPEGRQARSPGGGCTSRADRPGTRPGQGPSRLLRSRLSDLDGALCAAQGPDWPRQRLQRSRHDV